MYIPPGQEEEFMRQWDARIEFENNFLKSRGWARCPGTYLDHNGKEYQDDPWQHPVTLKTYPLYSDAFDLATSEYIREKGWRHITEIRGWGKKEWNKPIEKWARYQSPNTKRIYSFLEAQWIATELDFNEDKYPEGCSKNTTAVNECLSNFDKDEYYAWFYLDGEKKVIKVWTDVEANAAIVQW